MAITEQVDSGASVDMACRARGARLMAGRSMTRPSAGEHAIWRAAFVNEGRNYAVHAVPGDRLHVRRRFADQPGHFLDHGHVLEQKDAGLMHNRREAT
jgi:hypothetical protein